MNLYTFPKSTLEGFIFNADQVLFDESGLKSEVAGVLMHLKANGVHMSVYSSKNTEHLTSELVKAGIRNCFELIMGGDMLERDDPYTDATRKSEECFQLDHVFKYVVVCNSDEVVEAAVQEGLRTVVIKDGSEIDPKLEEKCWKTAETIETLFTLYEKTR